MNLEELIKNKAVIISAAQNVQKWISRCERYVAKRFKGKENSYDDRNICVIAALLVDLSDKEESEKEAYFDEKIKEMVDAYEAGNIKDYIKQMYDSVATNENIDWSNQNEVEKILKTMKIDQALTTTAQDFQEEIFDLYPTHDDLFRLDTIIAKASMLSYRVSAAMQDTGFGEEIDNELKLGLRATSGAVRNPGIQLETQLGASIYDATLRGENCVILNPAENDHTKNFFFKKPISLVDHIDGTEYTEERYSSDYLSALATCGIHTAFEQLVVRSVKEGATRQPLGKFNYYSLLSINGKCINDIIKDVKKKSGVNEATAEREAGKMLRDALIDGKSVVTLTRPICTNNGHVKFERQEIKVDLDKLNEIDRKENHYSKFRRFLDKHGIWKIKKFKSNAERDAKQEKIKNSAKYVDSLRATEDRMINIYNNIDLSKAGGLSLANIVPKIGREPTNIPPMKKVKKVPKQKVSQEKVNEDDKVKSAENIEYKPMDLNEDLKVSISVNVADEAFTNNRSSHKESKKLSPIIEEPEEKEEIAAKSAR